MRFFFVFLTLVFGCSLLNSMESVLRLCGYPPEGLVGGVKKVKEFTGRSLSNLQATRLIVMNEAGDVVSVEQYSPGGLVSSRSVYTYNERGLLIEIAGSYLNHPGQWRYEYRYNQEGQLSEELSWACNQVLEWRNEYRYGRLGRLVEKIVYQADGTETMRELYRYDQEGRLSHWLILFPDGKLLKQVDFFYNDLGLVERAVYHNENAVYKTKRYFYNKNSLWERVQTTDHQDTELETTLYFYNGAGQLVEEITRKADGTLKGRRTMSYDHKGNELVRIDAKGNYLVKEISY